MNTPITVHMIVKNEEQWVWYSIMSVLHFVQKIVIFDTGSTDNTISIINKIDSDKIELETFPDISGQDLVSIRNEQIDKTLTDWFMLLDGDEVWPITAMQDFLAVVTDSNSQFDAIALPVIIPVGNLFHAQPESAGRYEIQGNYGHFNIRGYRKSSQYKWMGVFPLEAYTDKVGRTIQSKNKRIHLLKRSYWHMTHMRRSKIDTHNKFKLEIGEHIFTPLPEVFFLTRPVMVPTPWITYSAYDLVCAQIRTPIVKIKRILGL